MCQVLGNQFLVIVSGFKYWAARNNWHDNIQVDKVEEIWLRESVYKTFASFHPETGLYWATEALCW